MSEPVTTRESELEARARKVGLTLIRPPADTWVIIFQPGASADACLDLDEVEAVIAANEGSQPPWARLPASSGDPADPAVSGEDPEKGEQHD